MKRNFTRASVLAAMAALAVSGVEAKDVYLSAEGSDSNTGLTADSPRKTMTNLTSILEAGDVIHISGMLSMADEYDLAVANNNLSKGKCGHFYKEGNQNGFQLKIDRENWMNITFVGENPEEDGFDGANAWRFFELGRETNKDICLNRDGSTGFDTENAWVSFQNIGFYNGVAPSEGGTFYIHDHIDARFDNCYFENNGLDTSLFQDQMEGSLEVFNAPDATAERGGAIHFQFGKLTITNSTFFGNTARRGGAVCQTGGDLVIRDCLFQNNGAEWFDKPCKRIDGGALFIWTLHTSTTAVIDRCAFVGNSSWSRGGAIMLFNNVDSSPDRIVDATITNCYFGANNAYWEHGGAVAISNADGNATGFKHIFAKFGNCTFFGNSAAFYGGQMYWTGGNADSFLSLANCTMAYGIGNGNRGETNGGHGPNICFDGNATNSITQINVEFLNTVMENNKATNGSFGDISFLNDDAKAMTNFTIDHCAISRIPNDDKGVIAAKATNSLIGYCEDKEMPEGKAVLHPYSEDLGASALTYNQWPWGAAPINPDGDAATMGDKKHYVRAEQTVNVGNDKTWNVRPMDISATDMNGKPRGANAIIGANEIDASELYDIALKEEDITDRYEMSGVESVVVESGKLQINVVGGVVTSVEGATISAYSVGGGKVAQAKDALDLNSLASGVYVVTARKGGAFAVAKIAK